MGNGHVAVDVSPSGGVSLAGFSVFIGSDRELLDAMDAFRQQAKPCLVVTANVDQAIDLSHDAFLREAYKEAALRTLDGMPLVWLAKIRGARRVFRQTGADMLVKCAAASAERGWRIVVLGGSTTANDSAVERLRGRFSQSDVVGMHLPYVKVFQWDSMRSFLAELAAKAPTIVFICLGSPKQEKFFMELRDHLPPAVYIGAGAAVDFASGVKSRAPYIVQRVGMEWVWRLMQEPRRLGRRYLVKGAAVFWIAYYTIRRK